MALGYGDRLARGAHRASFGPNAGVSQEKWNDIFGEDSGPVQKKKVADRRKRKSAKKSK